MGDNSEIFKYLHGMFRRFEYFKFGIAFPKNYIQVFANDSSYLELLVEEINSIESMMELCYVSKILEIDTSTFTGTWKSYTRFKIPTRKADSTENHRRRFARLLQADSSNMLYFNTSKTRYYINILEYDTNPFGSDEILSNTYGIARATSMFCVPHVY